MLGREALQGAVTFISFRHEIFAARVPVSVAAENRYFGAYIMGRMQSALAQHVSGHCRGSCFTVHPRNNDSSPAPHDCSQRLSATDSPHMDLVGALKNGVVRLDRG